MLISRGRSSSTSLSKTFSLFKYKTKYISSLSTLPARKWQAIQRQNRSNNVQQNRAYTRDSSKNEKVSFYSNEFFSLKKKI
jgi:hypothetical protein